MIVIAITIQKGGVGKSTTTHEIAANLAAMGHKVLAADLDPQQNLSRMANADLDAVTIYDVLAGDVTADEAIQTVDGGFDIIIADKLLKKADRDFADEDDIYRLAAAFIPLHEKYDFAVIDTPPSLGILPSMALTAAHFCLIPCEATSNGIQGLGQLAESIREVREQHNPDLRTLGIVLTQYTWRTIFNRVMKDQIQELAESMDTKVLETSIRSAVVVQEAQGFGQSLVEYAPKSKPAQDYRALTEEIMKEMLEDGRE